MIGVGEAKVAFIDTDSIKTGEDWNSRIAGALQITKVLVCVYSPNFFSKERRHEYCAKEFDAFLRRHTDLRYESIVEGGQTIVRIRGHATSCRSCGSESSISRRRASHR